MTVNEEKKTPGVPSDDDLLLDISTKAEAACRFAVDDETYSLRSLAHLNKKEEAKVRWLLKREELLINRFNSLNPDEDERGEELADKIRDVRVDVICMMTDCPNKVVQKLGIVAQMTILKRIGRDLVV